MHYFRLHLIALILCCSFVADAQRKAPTVIELDNPGFEGTPKFSTNYISGWKDCGRYRFPKESPVDLQPGFFKVKMAPKEGDTYLGMVARDNDSWESVTQLLRTPLQPNQCYTFSLHLAASPTYQSDARGEGIAVEEAAAAGIELEFIHHTTPIALRIYGSTNQCSRGELLAKTGSISNNEWEKFDFRFQPKGEVNFIMLEDLKNVYNKDDIQLTLNDKRYSDFDFDMSTGVLTAELPLRKGANKIDVKGTNAEGQGQATTSIRHKQKADVVAVVPKPKEENSVSEPVVEAPMANTLVGVKREDLKKDLKLEIKNLAFRADSTNIQEIHEKSLLKIVRFLNSNKDVTIEIGGHTNDRCDAIVCNQLSEDRALSVLQFLVRNGVDENQLRSKGYGSEQPIASNNSSYGRRRNQRVEIKILDVGS